MKTFILTLTLAAILLSSCAKKEEVYKPIVNPSDYAAYLNRNDDEAMKKIVVAMKFCTDKLAKTPTSQTYLSKLAGLYSSRFQLNGRIEDIFSSDSIYNVILKETPGEYSYIHRAQATNCITQHQFREAYSHVEKALAIGDGKGASTFMLVDVDVELGDLDGARHAMASFTNPNMFAWLIREAKIKDHEGKLDTAILLMEKALAKVKMTPSGSLWTLSNLADMYGHAGRVQDAYNAYLEVLKIDPDYDYALKGIAWIAFSHDHNTTEAKKIATWISTKRATPDMHLFLAQIAKAENNQVEKEKELARFTKAAKQPRYGDMYNKYIALLEADEFANPGETVLIAQREVHNRPTPQSFDLLAWGYFRAGDVKAALQIAREHIENHTSEPDALYHLGMIYKSNGMDAEAKQFLERAAESSFELGPEKAKVIKDQLSS